MSNPVRPEFSPLGESIEGYSLFEKSLKEMIKFFQFTKKEVCLIGITPRYNSLRESLGANGKSAPKEEWISVWDE